MLAPDIEDMIARNVYLRRMESVFKDINLLGDGWDEQVDYGRGRANWNECKYFLCADVYWEVLIDYLGDRFVSDKCFRKSFTVVIYHTYNRVSTYERMWNYHNSAYISANGGVYKLQPARKLSYIMNAVGGNLYHD